MNQAEVGLRLTWRLFEKLLDIISVYDKEVQFQKVYKEFSVPQRQVFDQMAPWKRKELLKKIIDDDFYEGAIPKDFHHKEMETFIELDFPLLDEHLRKLSDFQAMNELTYLSESATNTVITYEELIQRHLDTLKKVREKENDIPPGLMKDWVKIENFVRQLKNKEEIDYDSFKVNLKNLLYVLRIDPDVYL